MQAIRTKSFITARNRNSNVKLVKLQNSVAKCCKIRKIYSPAKFANFLLYLYYAQEKSTKPTTFETKVFFVS